MTLQEILASLLNPGGHQAPVNSTLQLQAQQRGALMPHEAPQQQPMPPQAPQGQTMPQSAPQAAPQPQGGGLGAIGGILQNIIAPQSAQKNQTVGWLTKQGLDPGTATVLASDKGALRSYILQKSQGRGATEFDQRAAAAAQNGLDPASPEGRTFILTGKLGSDTADKPPASYQEFQLAKQDGYKGNYVDWQTKSVREQDPTFGREKDLRQEYEQTPIVKGYQVIRDNYERIRQGAQQKTGAGDLAIVFGYMKMLDPTSVVREGEQASASNTAGVPAAIRNTYNNIMSGDKLSPEARQQMLSAAEQVYSETSKNLGDLNTRYSGIAGNYQLDPKRIVQMPEQYDPIKFDPLPAQGGGDLPLPPPQLQAPPQSAPAAPAAPVAPSAPAPNAAPVVDWKDYFGKKK